MIVVLFFTIGLSAISVGRKKLSLNNVDDNVYNVYDCCVVFYYRPVGHICEENKNVNAAQFGNYAMCFIDRASQSYNAVQDMKLLLQKMSLLVVIYY